MGKFDGILIASDWDGTLFYNGDVSSENVKAIEYFIKNGGYFTICSGRYFNFLKLHSDKVKSNTYSICLNGAYIANVESGEVFYKKACDDRLFEYIELLFIKLDEYDKIMLYPYDSDEPLTYYKAEYAKNTEEIKQRNYFKAVLYAKDDAAGDKGKEHAKKYELDGYCAVRSFKTSLEILLLENTKGVAIKRLAEHLGAKLTIAVGDYENDISMLRAADVGYAVANATDEVKMSADKVTVDYSNSAIAKVIEDIETNILPQIK